MKTLNLILATLVAVAAFTQSAFALTIDVTYNDSAKFGAGGVGYATGQVSPYPGGDGYGSVGLGGDNFKTEDRSYDFSATGFFNTWCVDIKNWLIGGTVKYDVLNSVALATAFGTGGADRVAALQKLANQDYSIVDTQVESAAFQIATWAIMFGTPTTPGVYGINSNGFKSQGNEAANTLAADWLSHLNNNTTTGNYSITYLTQPLGSEVEYGGNTQDMVVFTQVPVPEPGTMMLLGFGMLGLAIYGKRRMNKEA